MSSGPDAAARRVPFETIDARPVGVLPRSPAARALAVLHAALAQAACRRRDALTRGQRAIVGMHVAAQELERSTAARELVAGILALCQRLRGTVVAEGVETAGQLQLLRTFDCPLVQGYHRASPARAEELTDRLGRLPNLDAPSPLLSECLPPAGSRPERTPPDGTQIPGRWATMD